MSALTRLSLANRGLVALIAIVISGFGLYAIPSLKQQLFPSIELPAAFVSAVLPGASPEAVEEQVTKPIEDAVKGIDGIDSVTSTSRENVSSVVVLFEFGTDIESAVNQVTTSVNRIQQQLPENVDPTVFAGGTDDIPAIVLAASSGDKDEAELLAALNETVVPELNGIEGVRDTQVTGARALEVVITPDMAKMGAAGVSPASLTTVLQANGVSIPAGTVVEGDKSLTVQVGTPITTVDQLKDVYLTGSRGPVRLGDVAAVESKLPPAESYTRTDGVNSLGIAVTARPDGNPVDISHEVRDMLLDLEKASGATLTVITDQAPYVERSIESLTTEGLLGLLMAVVVILIFLMSVRSTLVTAVSIPLSVLIALIALWVGDYTLNLLTLGALTIAIGRVVDDSIVVLENIKRHLEYGEEKVHAILTAVREVAGAVVASTLTTVAVFAPIALVGGLVGQIFSSFAITVTVALLASLVVSLTIVPVLAYWFLKPPPAGADTEAIRKAAEEKELRSPLQRGYLPVIRFATTKRWTTVLIGIAVLIGTFALSTRLETNFLDESGQDSITISQEMPAGTSLAATDEAAKQVEAILADQNGVKTYQVTVGGSSANPFAGGGGAGTASYNVALEEDADAAEISDELDRKFDALSGAGEIKIGQESSGLGSSQLSVSVTAPDNEVLTTATEQVRTAMAGVAGVADIDTSLAESVPRLDVVVDRKAAAQVGLTEAQIAQNVAALFQSAPAGQINVDGTTQDVVISFGTAPTDTAALRAVPLTTPRGVVPLDQVADVKQVDGAVEINRVDGSRTVTVTGTVTGDNLTEINQDLTAALEELDLPAGAEWAVGGVSADQQEAFGQLGLAVLAAIAIVFVIMVATFRSLIQPVILLVSIPFAATGAIILLLITGTALGVPALIGVLMLVGIVVTNAIVLMDLINHYRAAGYGVQEAVIEGGRHRLRPILMTAIATIFALIPMALGLTGEGGFISQPLAIVVIGGLVSSTLLTLILVPTLYTMVENRKEKSRAKRQAKRLIKGQAAGEPKHAADKPVDDLVPAGVAPDSSGGAHEVPETGGKSALRGLTDQFEVLKMPRKPANPAE
ncbi:hydrogenase expression protein [Actinoplanes lobatus]|uniref:HAE1 family hydrophobic/amphiphilic exporter-1 n=1 Tax=Actinoplanes lobatus TaxID=113568 RepID=A0A7W7HAM2_9ACTN|nr:efflux RND transporter permease subunit [Actinoplanes lobatus]MBB4746892.1 HAE1 family hydrophobic/amphiphilic exporter-1 [Actinoplanes lobatus]GGN54722.1 hydrogenase expression protein [Actinoplanes lobatus]GIE41715.1 hydrogenase expression protein [Actinoplanes lobatus]